MAFGNGFTEPGESVMAEINMIPLVDIMLVLLIIFMITVPVVTHTVRVDLPRAANSQSRLEPETVTIVVTAEGAVHWNQALIDAATLAQLLATAATADPQPHLHLHGDRRVEYEKVIQVMAAAQRAGVRRIGFVTNPGASIP